jgi:hypothetical protein
MRGAAITINCDCGRAEHVAYGDTWDCPDCGRRWNTNQIPAEDYWGIMRQMRAYRLRVIGATVALAAVIALLFVTTGSKAISLAPLVMGGWFFFYMPRWRQRMRRAARNLPTWDLRPE